MTKEELKVKVVIAEDKAMFCAERKSEDFREWWYKNRDYVIVLAPAAIGGLKLAHKGISKHAEAKARRDLVEKRVWDPSCGIWYELYRPMTNSQRLQFGRMRSKGLTAGEILSSMGILR